MAGGGPAARRKEWINLPQTKPRPGSEVVRQLMTGFSFKTSPEACDITLGECLDLYRDLLLREAAEGSAGKK